MTSTQPLAEPLDPDPERALTQLGALAEGERQAREVHERWLWARGRAVTEAVLDRPDLNIRRAALRMEISRQMLYKIKDKFLAGQ